MDRKDLEKRALYNLPTNQEREISEKAFELMLTPDEPVSYKENKLKAFAWAREMWLTYSLSNREIEQAIDVSPFILSAWINGRNGEPGWKAQRAEEEKKAVKLQANFYKERVKKSLKDLLELVDRSMEKLKDENKSLSVQELAQLQPLLSKLMETQRLIDGEPNEISQIKITGEFKTSPWDAFREKLMQADKGVIEYIPEPKPEPKEVKAKPIPKEPEPDPEPVDPREGMTPEEIELVYGYTKTEVIEVEDAGVETYD